MSTPDQRARDKDRDAAIKLVKAACADGRIVEADRDRRVEQLRAAQTLGEIDLFVQDLRPAAAWSPPPAAAPPPPVPQVDYGPPSGAGTDFRTREEVTGRAKSSRAVLIVPLVAVIVAAIGIVGAVLAAVGSLDTGGGSSGSSSRADVDVLTVEGYGDLVAAVRDATGATTAFEAVLYPTYAVLELPVDTTTNREEYWYWDGELSRNDAKSTSSYERFDLRTVDPAVVVRLVKKVRTLVEAPETWYAIVRAPDQDRAMIWAYATNEYGESEYLGARRDGTVVYDSTAY